ncbi:putative mitochondrial import inner membrane translocase subunit TIM22 [Helianthus annuus]|nr:putative mitochondrial import inner membrane translocase subunit TIM22 [Helianthus annuus]
MFVSMEYESDLWILNDHFQNTHPNTSLNFKSVLIQVSRIFIRPRGEDVMYNETRAMLSSLGLEKYEKNFKIGLLTDNTLLQLTDKQV